jgi:hypothetical protein
MLMPRWRLDGDFLDLLRAWDEALPLLHGSGLAQRELAMHLYAVSDARLGMLAAIITKAAAVAIVSGQERITIELLDAMGLEVPASFTGFLF